MLDQMLSTIREHYKLIPKDTRGFDGIKLSGMRFAIKCYEAEGLGHICQMQAVGFFGLMKMDTLVINPDKQDLPLFSYDRIHAMGNDTLILELYDTMVNPVNTKALEAIKKSNEHLPKKPEEPHWYDDIRMPVSLGLKGKKDETPAFDTLTRQYLETYLMLQAPALTDPDMKKQKALLYVNGLLDNGGPSTDVFIKALGKERTAEFFHQVMFGV